MPPLPERLHVFRAKGGGLLSVCYSRTVAGLIYCAHKTLMQSDRQAQILLFFNPNPFYNYQYTTTFYVEYFFMKILFVS